MLRIKFLKDELKKVINQSNIYYQNTLKKNKELEIKINSFKDLEKSKNSLLEENISLNNKIKRLTEEKEEIRILKTEMENKYKVLEKDLIDLKKKSDTVNNNSINMENNNLSISLDDFNSIYGTTIQNSTITTLDLNSKKEGNKLIKNLSNMNFQNLEELLLFEDEISDLNPLTEMKLQKLNNLQLYNNKIYNIKPLEKIELNNLKKLYLQNNCIVDIKPLIKLNCADLKILCMDHNNISDIFPLSQVKFLNLQKLTLHKNNIEDILYSNFFLKIQINIMLSKKYLKMYHLKKV